MRIHNKHEEEGKVCEVSKSFPSRLRFIFFTVRVLRCWTQIPLNETAQNIILQARRCRISIKTSSCSRPYFLRNPFSLIFCNPQISPRISNKSDSSSYHLGLESLDFLASSCHAVLCHAAMPQYTRYLQVRVVRCFKLYTKSIECLLSTTLSYLISSRTSICFQFVSDRRRIHNVK